MITVFTPAYNRAYKLPALYESLQRQTCMDFEWILCGYINKAKKKGMGHDQIAKRLEVSKLLVDICSVPVWLKSMMKKGQ